MATPKSLIILIAVLLLIAGIGGWLIYKDIKKPTENTASPATITDNAEGNLTEEQIKQKMPDLDKEIVIKGLSVQGEAKLRTDIEDVRKNLKANYDNMANWLQLGLLYKAGEDFKGAEEAWFFTTIIRPKDPVAYHNLGDLYWLNMPDYPKSEAYFRKAIELRPHPMFYQKLSDLYRFSYKEKADMADDALIEGINANPEDIYLMAYLGDYYRDTGNKSGALFYYSKALEIDPANQQLQNVIAELKAKQ